MCIIHRYNIMYRYLPRGNCAEHDDDGDANGRRRVDGQVHTHTGIVPKQFLFIFLGGRLPTGSLLHYAHTHTHVILCAVCTRACLQFFSLAIRHDFFVCLSYNIVYPLVVSGVGRVRSTLRVGRCSAHRSGGSVGNRVSRCRWVNMVKITNQKNQRDGMSTRRVITSYKLYY